MRYKGVDTELQTIYIKDRQIEQTIKPFKVVTHCTTELIIDNVDINAIL